MREGWGDYLRVKHYVYSFFKLGFSAGGSAWGSRGRNGF